MREAPEHIPGEPIRNEEFEISGINHVALVCRDMERTVEFYNGVLGMPLVKSIALPNDSGYHFFFALGNGDLLAFFWFRDAPGPQPGIAAPSGLPGTAGLTSAIGSMNHLAFNVPEDQMEDYRRSLVDKGVTVTAIANHDDSPRQVSAEVHPGVFMRSVYFFDPDGILLEFASWTNAARALASDQSVELAAPVS
jgi:catechol 2,3-dioxygenase-like lactoylglutathione lyase family enzyme